ncbi:transposase [Sulfurimonas sp.]|jgi:REP element-mobilizing transposase RayT|uniref:transposase n=1 Tax=Sulfurimonas sp. TaxID=2022749 RepID=UPI002A3712F8|nr:transposase [Sulfurimonas sp.]MDY0122909.1 transposase [Sulfurimonas sp.]
MPRKERYQEAGCYHIINRGVERRSIYLEPKDYEFFLDLLLKLTKEYEIIMHAFCLMTNHYHLLLETKQNNLSKAIQFLNDKYAKYFNKKYTRNGHLWQGRYKSYPLFDDAHFWIVAKYIERNPVKASMVKQVDLYKYQSFFQWKYKHNYFELLNNSMIFEMTYDEYADYVSSELDIDAIDIVYKSPKLITKDGKLKVLKKRIETFFELDRDINRDINVKNAFEYGYTQSEIASFLELNPSTVARIIKK